MDAESGAAHYQYQEMLEAAGSAYCPITSLTELHEQVHLLAQGKHGFTSLVIDPISVLYQLEVDAIAAKNPRNHFEPYTRTDGMMRRIFSLLLSPSLDMNVFLTAHEATKYEDNVAKGVKPDGWKRLAYQSDLNLRINMNAKGQRMVEVEGSRLPKEFPQGDKFPWSWSEFQSRWGEERLQAEVQGTEFASKEQVQDLTNLLSLCSDDDIKKWKLTSLMNSDLQDLEAERAVKAIEYIKGRLEAKVGA